MPIFTSKTEKEAGAILSLVIQGLSISPDRGIRIVSYVNTLMRDYENLPSEALKEIPLNLKSNEKFFASFVLGNRYAPIFIKMNTEEVETFLSGIAESLKIYEDKETEILDYLVDDVMGKMVEAKMNLPDIVKNMANSKFSDIEKDYIFFSYGLNFVYGKIS